MKILIVSLISEKHHSVKGIWGITAKMKKIPIIFSLILISLASLAQYSPTLDTLKLYRGGRLWELITYGEDSLKVNGNTYDLAYGARSVSYWTSISVTRVDDSTFKVDDDYTGLLSSGVCLKWEESGIKQAMIISSSYGAETIVNIMGDDLNAGFTGMKYGKEKARTAMLSYAGTVGSISADVMGHWYAPFDCKIYGISVFSGTAGVTGKTQIDCNSSEYGSLFTIKPAIASGDTSALKISADDRMILHENNYLSIDIDEVTTDLPAIDLYVMIYYTALRNIYLP